LDGMRDMLEDLGGGLGVTDPVSGSAVVKISPPKPKAKKRPAKAKRAAKRPKAKRAKAKKRQRERDQRLRQGLRRLDSKALRGIPRAVDLPPLCGGSRAAHGRAAGAAGARDRRGYWSGDAGAGFGAAAKRGDRGHRSQPGDGRSRAGDRHVAPR